MNLRTKASPPKTPDDRKVEAAHQTNSFSGPRRPDSRWLTMLNANTNALRQMAREKSWLMLLDFAVSCETDGVDVHLGTGDTLVPAVMVLLKYENGKARGRRLLHADDGRIVEDRCV